MSVNLLLLAASKGCPGGCPAQWGLAPWGGISGGSNLLSHSPCWAFLQNSGGAWPLGGCQSVLGWDTLGHSWQSVLGTSLGAGVNKYARLLLG